MYTVDNAGLYTKKYLTLRTHIYLADPIVIEKLKEQNKLLGNDKLNHSYPHSWRSKAPLFIERHPNGLFHKKMILGIKQLRLSMILFFIQIKEKRDYYQW